MDWRLVSVLLCIILFTGACTQDSMLADYLESNRAALEQPLDVNGEMVEFEVRPGMSGRAIAQALQTQGIIGDARLFEAYVRINGLSQRLEAGRFQLSPSMTPAEIASALQNSQAAGTTVTIPEGWRLEQIADYLSEGQLVDGTQYRALAASGTLEGVDLSRYPFLTTRPAGTSLEGYLFPDTYQLPVDNPSAADLLQRQLSNFADQVVPLYDEAVAAGTTTLDLYAVLTLASIVEREAVVPAERPDIARVYLNRLAVGMVLNADPTVQYAMGYQAESGQWWKTPVTLEEYGNVNSPYNTYLYTGLPPGPIANPGLDSIRAVLAPADNDYIYFVALPDGSGAHVFAVTYEEHIANVQRYQQGQ